MQEPHGVSVADDVEQWVLVKAANVLYKCNVQED